MRENFFWLNMWNYLQNIAGLTLKKVRTPLLIKEASWRLISWVAKAGKSDPVSWLVRPWVTHKGLKRTIGLVIAVMALAVAVWGPIPSLATDTGGPLEVNVLPEGNVELVTHETNQVPVEHYRVSQGYRFYQPGMDLAAKIGEPVKPMAKGKVVLVQKDRWNYGQHVIVDHGDYQTLYAHLSKINVAFDQEVDTETVLGEIGSTGRSTGPHLHLEIREGNKTINPKSVLDIK